jgi:16S rRNA (cytidine1402-2'-O)-methyltransferase
MSGQPPHPRQPVAEENRSFSVDGHMIPARPLSPGLYVVATPIGNLGDVSLRALATLAAAELIACEDTRVTRILTGRYGIETRLIAYNDHNAERQRPKLLAALAEGKAVALVSDAGTPLISDPGYRLVKEALAEDYPVIPIPGASAPLAALVASGQPSDTFLFAGFLPTKQTARRKRLMELTAVPATLIFFESPQRLAASLSDMAAVLGGERPCAVARELTKTFETIRRATLSQLAAQYGDEPPPKGEVVVVVGPPGEAAPAAEEVDAILRELLKSASVRDAVAEAAASTGLSRSDLYRRALALKNAADDGPK